jgi:hypothetical protein
MPRTKSPDQAAAKWRERAANASGDYADGVQNPKEDWETATKRAEATYKTAVTAAANAGRFGKGVTKAGNAKQVNNSLTKGVARYGTGVAGATTEYAQGVAPFLEIIQRTNLPPRGPKGDAANINRVATLAAALHAGKLAGK